MKPILVTRISEDSLEVLTDYQTTLVKATVDLDLLNISRGSQRSNSEEGLIGAMWSVDGVPTGSVVKLLVKHYRGEGGEYEYLFKV